MACVGRKCLRGIVLFVSLNIILIIACNVTNIARGDV